jgi:hypothetical protein
VVLSARYGSACLSRFQGWTRATVANSSTSVFLPIATSKGLSLRGPVPAKRMIAATWSRRTVMWCAVWRAMTDIPQKRRIDAWKGFIPMYGCM